jgi:uncharacterized protein (DUF58 family)
MQEPSRGVPSLFTITLVQVLVAVLLFIALLNGQRDLVVLTLLVLGIIGGTRLWARISLASLSCHFDVDKWRVFRGERIVLSASAENAKPLPVWLKLQIPIGNLFSTGERVLTQSSSLLWYERRQFRWEFIAERRGVYQLGPLDIQGGDLFSFFSRSKRSDASHSLVVFPRLVSLNSLSLPKRDFFGAPRAPSPVQDPIYILGTRDYQQGQPSKHIHWKASARHNRLQEKVFESTVQEKVLLVVDVEPFESREMEDDFECILEIVASMAVRLDKQGHAVGLVTNGVVNGKASAIVPAARHDQQVSAILEVLARLEMKAGVELKGVLRRALADAWGISCLCFSCEEDETVFSASEFLARRRTPAMFVVSQPRLTGVDQPEMHHRIVCVDDLYTTPAAD